MMTWSSDPPAPPDDVVGSPVPPPPPPLSFPGPGTPTWGSAPGVPPKGTNGLAIAALVCPLAACGIGSILGIVFGHVARRQIRATGEGGSGLALAGMIIGYATLLLCVVALGAIAVFANTSIRNVSTVDEARDFERGIVLFAASQRVMPRDRVVIVGLVRAGCCESDGSSRVTVGSTSIGILNAETIDLERARWRLEVQGSSGGSACLTVPKRAQVRARDVVAGHC